jgi:hypothetical protein
MLALFCKKNEGIDEQHAKQIGESGITEVKCRSVY